MLWQQGKILLQIGKTVTAYSKKAADKLKIKRWQSFPFHLSKKLHSEISKKHSGVYSGGKNSMYKADACKRLKPVFVEVINNIYIATSWSREVAMFILCTRSAFFHVNFQALACVCPSNLKTVFDKLHGVFISFGMLQINAVSKHKIYCFWFRNISKLNSMRIPIGWWRLCFSLSNYYNLLGFQFWPMLDPLSCLFCKFAQHDLHVSYLIEDFPGHFKKIIYYLMITECTQ